jgi:N-methylhydantoinase A
MRTYLQRLADRLKQIGVRAPLQVMASNGGIMGGEIAARLPVFVVASGPAGGVTGSAALAQGLRERDFVVFDMGGTTAKASILEERRPALITEYEFRDGMSSPSRFIKGGGYMLKVPAIDIAEVGAGGGSIAFVDQGGLLRVGPESAGAVPGPACYGLGNQLPTVTDANMCLGYLNSEFLAGGSLKVQRSLAESAVADHVGSVIGLSMLDAAHGIRQIANVNMARAIRSVTVERGKDPREMTMIAFGGNGPLHAIDVARILGIKRVVAPVLSGVFAAAGMLCADVEHNFVHASPRKLADVTILWLTEQVELLKRAGRDVLAREGYDSSSSGLTFFADLRYSGQSSELTLPFEPDSLSEKTILYLAENFRAAHKGTFGYVTGEPVEIANLRLTAIGRSEQRLRFSAISIVEENPVAPSSVRRVSLERGSGFHDVPLVQRTGVSDQSQRGPAIIESYDTTILIPPGCSYSADPVGNIVIDIES